MAEVPAETMVAEAPPSQTNPREFLLSPAGTLTKSSVPTSGINKLKKAQALEEQTPIKGTRIARSAYMDDLAIEIREFQAEVARAKHLKLDEVETTQAVIDYYNPNGLGGAEFFIMNNVKIFPEGKSEQIKAKMNESMGVRLHGAKEGTMVGLG